MGRVGALTPVRGAAILAVVLALPGLIYGCSAASQSSSGGTGGSGATACNQPCITFTLNINFTGLDNVKGTFVDNTDGSGYKSCAEFASGDSVGFAQGPGTPTRTTTQIGGKVLNFLFIVSHDKFHGPGTYPDVLAGGGVTIGNDTFFGHNSTETLNADGSGNASFVQLPGASNTGQAGTESGTVTWTCSK